MSQSSTRYRVFRCCLRGIVLAYPRIGYWKVKDKDALTRYL